MSIVRYFNRAAVTDYLLDMLQEDTEQYAD